MLHPNKNSQSIKNGNIEVKQVVIFLRYLTIKLKIINLQQNQPRLIEYRFDKSEARQQLNKMVNLLNALFGVWKC